MDFLLRYPTYLYEAAEIRQQQTDLDLVVNIDPKIRPESRLIRYKYGPWDDKYHDIFAYLVAKDFVEIIPDKKQGDSFRLTDKGMFAVEELKGPEFEEMVYRCKLIYKLFGRLSGSTLKKFIYRILFSRNNDCHSNTDDTRKS